MSSLIPAVGTKFRSELDDRTYEVFAIGDDINDDVIWYQAIGGGAEGITFEDWIYEIRMGYLKVQS